jgi:O-antigen/teichoic acid export membrane protein
MVLGNLFGAAYQIYGWGFGYVRRTFFLSAVVLVSGIVNVVLNAVLVGAFGYRAAAYATAASYLVMALLGWLANLVFLRQYCPSILIVLKPLALVVPFFAAYLGLLAWSPYWMVSLAIKVGLLSLYAGALVLFRIGRPAARDA